MAVPGDDWRRTFLTPDMTGLCFTWKNYQAMTGQWEHEHCECCQRKFLDPNYGDAHMQMLADDHYTAQAGYANLRHGDLIPGKVWICQGCFDDFKDEYQWTVVEADPDAWPYAMPEPDPRPTEYCWTDPGERLKRPE